MKKHYEPSIILTEIDDAIAHCAEQGLPLRAIELTPKEWANFLKTMLAVPGWNAMPYELTKKTIRYQGIRIFEGPAP